MPLHDALYSRLSNYAGLTALVGTRIWPIYRKQDSTLPAVVYQRIAVSPANAYEGSTGLRVFVQVTVYAETINDANAVAVQVKAAMAGWTGTTGDTTVHSADFVGDQDLLNTDGDGAKGIIAQALEFEVFTT